MSGILIGQPAPQFSLPVTGGTTLSLPQCAGKKLILYFYAKDNTAGCTGEAREFAQLYEEFTALNALILGVSRDSIASHEKFKAKLALPFDLLSDSEGQVCELYGVLKEKNMYGKKRIGVERSTFLINEQGIITGVFRKVKAAGHARVVLDALKVHSVPESN